MVNFCLIEIMCLSSNIFLAFFLVDDGVDVLGLVSCEGAVNLFEWEEAISHHIHTMHTKGTRLKKMTGQEIDVFLYRTSFFILKTGNY